MNESEKLNIIFHSSIFFHSLKLNDYIYLCAKSPINDDKAELNQLHSFYFMVEQIDDRLNSKHFKLRCLASTDLQANGVSYLFNASDLVLIFSQIVELRYMNETERLLYEV